MHNIIWELFLKMEKELKKIITYLNNGLKLVQIKEISMLNIILKMIISTTRKLKRI